MQHEQEIPDLVRSSALLSCTSNTDNFLKSTLWKGMLMAVDRTLWYAAFLRTELPHYPCPRCSKPFLVLASETLHVEETRSSKQNKKHPDWEPEWSDEKFVCLLRCTKCGDLVSVSGNIV